MRIYIVENSGASLSIGAPVEVETGCGALTAQQKNNTVFFAIEEDFGGCE